LDDILDVVDVVLVVLFADEVDLLGELFGGNDLDVVELGGQKRVAHALAFPILLLLLQEVLLQICFDVGAALGRVELVDGLTAQLVRAHPHALLPDGHLPLVARKVAFIGELAVPFVLEGEGLFLFWGLNL